MSSEIENSTSNNVSQFKPSKTTDSCVERYSTGQILIHNIPLFTMYILGTLLFLIYNYIFAIVFVIYLIISNYLFLFLICAYCPHYGTRTSLCGYGLVAKRITKRKSIKGFGSNFRRYIGIIFPNWFAPFIIGIILLIYSFSWIVLILLIIFSIIGFFVVPYLSKSKSCDKCKLKDKCPWMSLCSR
jgi:hypothetical protein